MTADKETPPPLRLSPEDLAAIRAVVREEVHGEQANAIAAPITLTVEDLACAVRKHPQTVRKHLQNNRRGIAKLADGPPYSIRFEAVEKCYNVSRQAALHRLKAANRLEPYAQQFLAGSSSTSERQAS